MTTVTDANGDPVEVPPNTDVDAFALFMAGRVPAACGHYIAASEARAGFTACEQCPPTPHPADPPTPAALNAAARFLPAGPDGYPAVQVGGVLVNVYIDPDGQLVISADFDESELGDPTPVVVRMSGETVFEES